MQGERPPRSAGVGHVAPSADDGVTAKNPIQLDRAVTDCGIQHGAHRVTPHRPAERVAGRQREAETVELDLECSRMHGPRPHDGGRRIPDSLEANACGSRSCGRRFRKPPCGIESDDTLPRPCEIPRTLSRSGGRVAGRRVARRIGRNWRLAHPTSGRGREPQEEKHRRQAERSSSHHHRTLRKRQATSACRRHL